MNDVVEKRVDELLTRGVAEAIDRDALRAALLSGKKLRVKLGIDPTSPNLHLGRAVALLKLRDFQELGHQVVFIVGDFTGIVGDTSDKESERPMLDPETVKTNMASYAEQAGKILDLDQVEVCHNSEWLAPLGFGEIGRLADRFSLAEFMARENIKKRYDEGKRVSLREVLYPLMQGYDSVAVRADVELGGTDQRFNLLAGRHLQPLYGQEPQNILMVNLIPGTDGRKMSSSWGNTINLLDTPEDIFGKVMRLPDEHILSYFIHATRVPLSEVEGYRQTLEQGENPRTVKLRLASEVTALLSGREAAERAERYFVETFSKKQIPEDIPTVQVGSQSTVVQIMVEAGFAKSKSDALRKIEQGGVSLDGEKLAGDIRFDQDRHSGKVLKVGKKDFARVSFSD